MNDSPSNETFQTTRGFNVIFIHSSLDDAGLTPQQFRVLAHISRRAGDGKSWASNETMADICKMHKDTLVESLKELERRKIITRTLRPGMTTLWRIKAPGNWDLTPLPTTGEAGRPKVRPNPPASNTPLIQRGDYPPASKGGHPPASKGYEGNPLKGINGRESNSGAGAPNVVPPKKLKIHSAEALAIYEAYPLKVARPKALDAIVKAFGRGITPSELLAKTKAFAMLRKGSLEYCPHPATWFNQERYNDDPATWARNGKGVHVSSSDHAKGF